MARERRGVEWRRGEAAEEGGECGEEAGGEDGELGLGVPFAWRRRRREATAIRVVDGRALGHSGSRVQPLQGCVEPWTVRCMRYRTRPRVYVGVFLYGRIRILYAWYTMIN
jgi:hypothetical protein